MTAEISAVAANALSASEQAWVEKLRSAEYGQSHLVPESATPADVSRLVKQIEKLDKSYPGGIKNYINRAKQLLADSANNVNPFAGYTPEVPQNLKLPSSSEDFAKFEKIALDNLDKLAFCLVAGGLGERLGYPNIKVSLPVETVTNTCYLEYYIKNIRAMEQYARSKLNRSDISLPLAVMTSGDTHVKTVQLLEENDFFGHKNIILMEQQKVPALKNNEAAFATSIDDPFTIETKPHGHGDVHMLLNQFNLPEKWVAEGREFLFIFQDTNALSMRALIPMLGVSIAHKLAMNSLAIPRAPGEAVGAICKLVSSDPTDSTKGPLTINVEYNQLAPLLKAAGYGGDVATESGHSPYPGNANVLLFGLKRYMEVLKTSGGTIPEFVNPKYKDPALKTEFKTPTRLECLMQEFPRLFTKDDNVGATELDRWFCFSTVKNNVADAVTKAAQGVAPEAALSGEADFYAANLKMVQLALARTGGRCKNADVPATTVEFNKLAYPMGPRVVISPSCAFSIAQLAERVKGEFEMKEDAVLVLDGDVEVKDSSFHGAAVIQGRVTIEGLKCENEGWKMVSCGEDEKRDEIKIRGFVFDKKETLKIKGGI